MYNITDDKFFEIDHRSKTDIIKDISDLAKSYVPEWVFNLSDPDAGSVIASIFAEMLEDDINQLNMVMYKYHIELMNMIGVTLKRSEPAQCVVKFSLLSTADEGAYVPKKTKLIANGNNDDKIIFETKNSMYVTNSNIECIYETSQIYGKIIEIFDVVDSVLDSGGQDYNQNNKGFYLFDYSMAGKERNELIIGHQFALNLDRNACLLIYFRVSERQKDKLAQLVDGQKYEWNYLTNDGWIPFKEVKLQEDKIELIKDQNSQIAILDNRELYYISVKQKNSENYDLLEISDIRISSFCDNVKPQIIYQGESQVNIERFYPFGDKLAVYNECYIGSDNIFSKKKAAITIKFNLSYIKNLIEFNMGVEPDYKLIMLKTNQVKERVVNCRAEDIVFEYFNGVGWAKLDLDKNYFNLFSGEISGQINLKFICPKDIEPILVNAYKRYWIRIRLLKADNCYRMPSYHLIPVISDLTLDYHYNDNGIKPSYIVRYSGMIKDNIVEKINNEKEIAIFQPIPYEENSIFIGFDKKFYDGPINIYFNIEGNLKKEANNIKFQYSCFEKDSIFKQLKVIDETENFRHAGSIIFMPPSDMAKMDIFGKDCYWIRIVDETNEFEKLRGLKVNDILINTVGVENVETRDPEVFYIDKVEPNMRFHLSSHNILSANIFVNEVNDLSIQQMDDMLKEKPDDVIVEYDNVGNYLSFFVKWQEVNNFIKSRASDRHYLLNRSEGVITFGDSIKGRIPNKNLREAIRVFVIVCNGEDGNVDIGAINKMDEMINFINGISNPIPGYAGHNIETINKALKRGANILSSYNRFISESDFERAIKDFSDVIDKVRCVASINEYGERRPQAITIAVLIKEFEKNSGIFYGIKHQIKERLLENSELSLKSEDLNIIDPIFVELIVDMWIKVKDYNMFFEIKNEILKYLKLFIDPISGNFHNEGWEIGTLPKEVQIYSFIKSKNINVEIQKTIITCRLKTLDGFVEKELSEVEENPFVIGINGTHNVFVDID